MDGLGIEAHRRDFGPFRRKLMEGIQGNTQSIYCYEGSDVLKNRFGFRNQSELQIAESFVSKEMERRILDNPRVAVNRFGGSLLSTIHRTLFGETYIWAGSPRKEAIAKDGTAFCQPENIVPMLKEALSYIQDKRNYKGQPLGEFVHSLASTHATLNQIHTFREGNGRTNRLFLTLLARYNGYDLDYSLVPKEMQLEADRRASAGDCTALSVMYASMIQPLEKDCRVLVVGGSKCPDLTKPYDDGRRNERFPDGEVPSKCRMRER